MSQLEIMLVSAMRVIVEVALFAMLGQGVLALLAGSHRHGNVVYKVFQTITAPVMKLVRYVTPKLVIDKHLPFVGFFFLFWLWILLGWAKRHLCAIDGLAC